MRPEYEQPTPRELCSAGGALFRDRVRPPQIVHSSSKNNHVANTGLDKHITIESCQRIRPQPIQQKMVAADALVQYADLVCCRRILQTFGQIIRPAIVSICRRPVMIRDEIESPNATIETASAGPATSTPAIWYQ